MPPQVSSRSFAARARGTLLALRRPRHRRRIDWGLIVCGVRGHVLIGADAEELRPEDRAIAREYDRARWLRCLRCDSWVAVARPASPARLHPPDRPEIQVPLRGKALRDRVVLRLIAVDRVLHTLILGLLGVAALVLAADHQSLRAAAYRVLTALQGGIAGGPVEMSGHVGIVRTLNKLFSLSAGTLRTAGIALLAYGLLEGFEAVGLWLGKRWAEYLTFVATTILLAPEIYELVHGPTILKVLGFIVNLAIVMYLLFAKRLFGLRGGGRVDASLRAHEMSWEAIERTGPPANAPAVPAVSSERG
jgi:uncharacterized membrane protein (DUF2068 family)